MKQIKQKLPILIFPLLVVILGIFMLSLFDPFYSKSSDPEYPYLVNGLNCARLKFSWIGHTDHPGTPVQVYEGIMIRITHLISGNGNLAQDVFARPEHYLNAISVSMLVIQACLIFWIGLLGIRRKIPSWQILLLQAGCFFSNELIWFFCRVNPDRFFMLIGLLFTLVYLKHGFENRLPQKFAMWSGTVMALGLATKFNFLPLLFLPLLFIKTNKNRLIYIGSGIVSFIIFIAPIISKFGQYRRFVESIFNHDGLYGSGESRVLNLQKMSANIGEIFRLNPELLIIILVLIVLLFVAIRKRTTETKKFILPFAGMLAIIGLQIIMVSKHFKNYYLAPTFIFYGFMFFIFAIFLNKILQKKGTVILLSALLPALFLIITAEKSIHDYPAIANQISQREKIRNFVDAEISKNDFWFVEPTWESGPYVENAIVYGLSYCGHRTEYLPQLIKTNPNIITYEGNNEPVMAWRCAPISLDSVVATGKNIHIYSTSGRNAGTLLQMVKDAASRNNFQLSVDTIFSDSETQSEIIQVKATNSASKWKPENILNASRQEKINKYIETIKNSPEWLEKVKEKATAKKIPLDSMILLDAIWMTDNKK